MVSCVEKRKGLLRSNLGKGLCMGIVGLTAAVFSFSSVGQAATMSKEEFKAQLREVVRENPEIVLDALRNNSEAVLEIAQQGNMQRKRKVMVSQWKEDIKTHKKIDLAGRSFKGTKNAPVTIVAYSDFTCSFCRQSELLIALLLDEYKGKVRFVFKPLPKDENPASLATAKYSLAAFMQDEQKGWKFYDKLFANIEEVERGGDEYIKKLAEELGLDLKKLRADASGDKVEGIIKKDKEEADQLGITGTPYFLVNDLIIRGAIPKEMFEEAIDLALNQKK